MTKHQPDYIGMTLLGLLFIALCVGGYISYKSIDFTVLQRMEKMPLVLPTPAPTNAPLK